MSKKQDEAVRQRTEQRLAKDCPACGHESHEGRCPRTTTSSSRLGTSFLSMKKCPCPGHKEAPKQ